MSRTAVCVDAGYLYAAGAIILTGSSQNRERLDLDHHSALDRLRATCDHLTGGVPILRFYWYDGLLRGRPSPEQEAVANTDNVKLRLGAVVGGQQKGVDSLIIMDLIELARNHAISEAVLLSGDEDLRVGVQLAQSFGVRVHLLGVEPTRGNQSYLLLQEADTTTEWNKDVVETIMSVKPYVETYLDSLTGPITLSLGEGEDEVLDRVASEVVGSIGEDELSSIAVALARDPRWVPPDSDRLLLLRGSETLSRELTQTEKRYIREKFREAVSTTAEQ